MTSNLKLTLERALELRAMLGDDPDLVLNMLEAETDLFEIIDWALDKLSEEEGMEEAIASRVKSLGERKASSQARQDKLRSILHELLNATGEKSLRRPEATLTLKAVKPSIAHVDEAALPERFFKVERKVSRSAINAALEAGEQVPGVVMSNGSETIQIRRS